MIKSDVDVILKTYIGQKNKTTDNVKVTSHSFNGIQRTEMVSVFGGDGRSHLVPVNWIDYVPVTGEGEFSVGDLGTDDEIKFRSLGQKDVIYAKGLVSTNGSTLNVDINSLKSFMSKD